MAGASPVTPALSRPEDLSDGAAAFALAPPRRWPLCRGSSRRSRGQSPFFFSELGGFGHRCDPLRPGLPPPTWIPHGLSTCGRAVEGGRLRPRFPEACRPGDLGESRVFHRLSPPGEPFESAFLRRRAACGVWIPGRGRRKIVRAPLESKGNDGPCALLSHRFEIVMDFRVQPSSISWRSDTLGDRAWHNVTIARPRRSRDLRPRTRSRLLRGRA